MAEKSCIVTYKAGNGEAQSLSPKHAQEGKHGHAGVLELGLTHPVQIETKIADVGKTKGIEAFITSHGSIQVLGLVQDGDGPGLLSHHGGDGSDTRSRGKSHGRANDASKESGTEPTQQISTEM